MVKQLQGMGLFAAGAAVLLAAQPVWAQATQVTAVRLNPTDSGLNVVLDTNNGDRPQIFTVKRGQAAVADIINTRLQLPGGSNFRQDNPAPGIASVEVTQIEANSIRVVVTGNGSAPSGQIGDRNGDGITLSFTPAAGTATAPSTSTDAQPPVAQPAPDQIQPTPTAQAPDVLIPSPDVTIDGAPAPALGTAQAPALAPPFLPRAISPPVGDISVSNTDASPSAIDLGTAETVPRLVLRDAPVREVLSLLARAAGLNLVFTGGQPGSPGAPGAEGPTISLDVENESVQDVFNNVLRLSGLEANRTNRTIFVGTRLPNTARDVIVRSLRLNQVTVGVALNFLVGMGAESAVSRERLVTSVNAVPVGGAAATAVTQTQTTTENRLETQRVEFTDSTPLLRGLQALGDERTNSVTLIGTPRQIDVATAQLIQLDSRRRQVAVNVKIVDVNLLATDNFSTSFSFGIGNNFFVNDNGAAALNFGGSRPPTAGDVNSSVTSPPIIGNPISGAPFFDANQPFTVPNGGSGVRVIQNGFITSDTPGDATFLSPIAPLGTNGDPTAAGISSFTPGTPDTVTITTDPTTGVQTSTFAAGTRATATFSLPTLFQFPRRFLSSLQAQVVSGNAKILTDPTLIVQEGQTANVNLTQEVVGNIEREVTNNDGGRTETLTTTKEEVGLTLNIRIERIDDNGFISLSVAPVVRAPQAPENINLGGGSTQRIFLVSERSLNSGLIRLRDSQTLILSGIIQDSDRTTVSKIPILGDIPLLGALFRSTNRQNQRQEVIVLLTPQILDDSERSSFGYNYTPGSDVRQILERRGLNVPRQ